MAATSNIEWTQATWNPVVGCSKVSPGCAHCYAETMAARLKAMALKDIADGKDPGRKRHYIEAIDDKGRWSGKLIPVPEALADPLGWRKPRRVFVNSMSDLFHESVPDEFIDRVFAVMALSYWHTFQVLTKRAKRMAAYFENQQERIRAIWNAMGLTPEYRKTEKFPPVRPTLFDFVDRVRGYDKNWPWSRGMCGYFANPPWPLYNVWLGVSVEDKKRKDRIDWLRKTPAAVRFLSCEPLLEDLGDLNLEGLGWVIDGCESGPKRREYRLEWSRSIQAQCAAAGVPYFRKQTIIDGRVSHDPAEWSEDLRVREYPGALTHARP